MCEINLSIMSSVFLKINNVSAYFIILDKHIKADSIKHSFVSEYDDLELEISIII